MGIGHYTDWELRQSVEERILLKSICAEIQDNFGVTKTSLQRYLNAIFPRLKCSSLKHLWYLMSLGEIRNKTVRKTITEKIFQQEVGHKSYLLRDEESYIAATTEIEGARGLPRDNTTISDELQQGLHGVGRRDVNKTITPDSSLRYARRVIARVNKEAWRGDIFLATVAITSFSTLLLSSLMTERLVLNIEGGRGWGCFNGDYF